jgi:ribosomal protein S18 acetylase RimI-like enzyme
MHPLDNVIYNALRTRQAQFAEVSGTARKFQPGVTLLSGFESGNDEGYASLAGLAADGGTLAIFLDAPYEKRSGWEFVVGAPLLQMVHENGSGGVLSGDVKRDVVELGPSDSSDMIELTSLTKPGPFGPRTHELGTYLGIRINKRLASMAGERLKVPGYTEVSAVCTHPDFLGRGYAALLMREVMYGIRSRRETPFLHVREDNTRAIDLYKHLGFRIRKAGHFAVLRRTQL